MRFLLLVRSETHVCFVEEENGKAHMEYPFALDCFIFIQVFDFILNLNRKNCLREDQGSIKTVFGRRAIRIKLHFYNKELSSA